MSELDAAASDILDLPEQEFVYVAGSTDRPYAQFTGRWNAIQLYLAEMLQTCTKDNPLRVVDVGSCTGFFTLQIAHAHPEADVVGVEGSVGIGNGSVGMAGAARQILRTDAVQTHLRWVRKLGLPNCFCAPEVWDYFRVCELAALGRPICDAMFLLSVVHHIDGVSTQQYTNAGLSRLDGTIDLLAKLLLLAPRHFIELPNKPWMADAWAAYGSARGILEAASKASKRVWRFRGPIYTAEWFGQREVWILESEGMPAVDVRTCPFPMLCRGEETQPPPSAGASAHPLLDDMDQERLGPHGGGLCDAALDAGDVARQLGGLCDPGLMLLSGTSVGPVDESIGEAIDAAPTDLLIAHLALREAMMEAEELLTEVRVGHTDRSQDRPLPAGWAPGAGGSAMVPQVA